MQVPDAIDSLWKDGGARRIELQPLSDAAIEKLVETVLEGPVEQSALQRVVDASQGSLLYARELVIGALQEGRLVFNAGLWRLRRRAVSPALSALVNGRMGALEDAERYPLELLALGEPLRTGGAGTAARNLRSWRRSSRGRWSAWRRDRLTL